jgi:hypothetical protein
MSSLVANTAIQLAVAGILTSIAALIAAVANWLNMRTRLMEKDLQIADLQRQTTQIAAVQQVQTAVAASAPSAGHVHLGDARQSAAASPHPEA